MTSAPTRRILGSFAILAGLGLLAWVAAGVLEQRAVRRTALDELAQPRLPPVEAPVASPVPEPPPAPGSLVGRIVIAAAGVDAVALEGVDLTTLGRAVGHFPGTALPGEHGNASFAAHRDSFFRGLRRVGVGQEVSIETADAVYTYRIEETRVVDPEQIDVVAPRGGRQLTLVTCYPFDFVGSAPQRFVVHARWASTRLRDSVGP